MDEKIKKLSGALESILFIYGEPMPFKKACGLLSVSEEELLSAAEHIQKSLGESSGLRLMIESQHLQLISSPEYAGLIDTLIKNESAEKLTPAAEETLAIIAYGGPIARAEIDYIRGVNSSFILRNLSFRGLITREVDKSQYGTHSYKVSFDFLRHLGISKLSELPEHNKYKSLIEKMRGQNIAGENSAAQSNLA